MRDAEAQEAHLQTGVKRGFHRQVYERVGTPAGAQEENIQADT